MSHSPFPSLHGKHVTPVTLPIRLHYFTTEFGGTHFPQTKKETEKGTDWVFLESSSSKAVKL